MTTETSTHTTRVANTEMIRAITRRARMLNRGLSPKSVKRLDPEGIHILTILMPHEHAGGTATDLHWRCRAYLKFIGSDAPVETIIDVLAKDWDKLPTLADIKAHEDA